MKSKDCAKQFHGLGIASSGSKDEALINDDVILKESYASNDRGRFRQVPGNNQ